MSFLIRYLHRRKKNQKEKFEHKTVLDRLEEEGFKPLIKSDILEGRLLEIRNTLDKILKSDGNDQLKFKGKLVDEAYKLFMVCSSAWARSMDNPWLAHRINCFIKLYKTVRNSPAYLDDLFMCACILINVTFTNIDVEPLRPIIIQTIPMKKGIYPLAGYHNLNLPEEREE
ncbi:hypothetical protein DRO69_02020 [Candidatus Bathyarchaeota archaeon]|nr:MAG: hypothetical protein DRO69_02020 [Candidatus Bathyarchaeota archaeon]